MITTPKPTSLYLSSLSSSLADINFPTTKNDQPYLKYQRVLKRKESIIKFIVNNTVMQKMTVQMKKCQIKFTTNLPFESIWSICKAPTQDIRSTLLMAKPIN